MSATSNETNNTDSCENCSSGFSLFKRKKTCSMCNQSFCQFCITRLPKTEEQNQSSTTRSNSSERICSSCKTICAPETNANDLLKLKLKHIRCVLNRANIPTNTCKEKRDLVDLMISNKHKFRNFHRPTTVQNPQQQQQQQSSQSTSSTQNSFNNTVNSIINNVQDFVSFNLNSVLNPNPVPCPPPPPRPDNRQNYNTSSSSTSSTSSNNFGSMFNFLGEQIPNVFSNTFSQFNDNQENNSESRAQQNVPETQPNRAPTPPPPPSQSQPTNLKRRASISDLKTEAEIENLSIKQIKEILANNFVEFKGCCERQELIDKLKRLYKSHQENKRLEKEINNNAFGGVGGDGVQNNVSSDSSNPKTIVDESDFCKICMESIIDCVLIECGHMCSCIKCGKQLAECPICRQNVVRVLRVFKS